MIGLIDLEVYNSNFIITSTSIKSELYKFPDEKAGGISYEKVRDEIEKHLDILDITAADLQDDLIVPNIIEEYKEQVKKKNGRWWIYEFFSGFFKFCISGLRK